MRKLGVAGLAFYIGGIFLPAGSVHCGSGGPASDSEQARATGMLEGIVTLVCAEEAVGCSEQPYQVPLQIEAQRAGTLPRRVSVSAAGKFSVSLPVGQYLIASGDTRGACCLPVLQPIAVEVAAGRTTNVHVRFLPGLQLPRR